MSINAKPKRAFIAYCVLAEKLNTPGMGLMQALTPFLAEACQQFSGELFDAAKFSDAVEEHYGIRIPRLAALGLAEQLAREGMLTNLTGNSGATVYQYVKSTNLTEVAHTSPVTETEVEAVLESFVERCRADIHLCDRDEQFLHAAFLDRLLNADSMRILSKRDASITAKKSADTLVLKKPLESSEQPDSEDLHLDFLVSQFLIDLRDHNSAAFEQVSNVAFANMAAEAIACFQEPPVEGESLSDLTIYLDSPLLLDMLGVNVEYAEYGRELLNAISASGAKAAVFDHCIDEAEAAIHAQLSYLRSGINQISVSWGTSARPDLLSALVGNVGDRAEKRLGIEVHRDPDVQLHRRSQVTVGNIEAEMNARMLAWRNAEAKEYDRKSVWAMLAIRNTAKYCSRICDSQSLLLTRNTPLVRIANDAWGIWLKGTTQYSKMHVGAWAPVAMSDKQFAGYLWARTGSGNGSISRARLLAHCSAAIRPRADVKARAYNLVLELSGREEADDIAALLEDREGARALMRASKGDPEDVTKERLPFILEQIKLAAGEFAATKVRDEGELKLKQAHQSHTEELEKIRLESEAAKAAHDFQTKQTGMTILQQNVDQQKLESENSLLLKALDEKTNLIYIRDMKILKNGLKAGVNWYRICRWVVAVFFGVATWFVAKVATEMPFLAAVLSPILGVAGFWFVPEFLNRPLNWIAMKRLHSVVEATGVHVDVPLQTPDFIKGTWSALDKHD